MHLELKAVSSLESLSTGHSQEPVAGFPVGSQSEYPLPKFDKEKPAVPRYSAVDMSNKKVYDDKTTGKLQKVNSLAPLPISVADAAIKANSDIDNEEKAYVSRKLHLDAYINGKRQLNALATNSKPKQNGNGRKATTNNNNNKLTPLEDKPIGKGFNSSQARSLNYPGRKREEVNKSKNTAKKDPIFVPVTAKPEVVSPVDSHDEDRDSVPIAVHSKLKKKEAPQARRPTVVGNPSDDSVFGINSAFDSRFENIMSSPLASMGSGQMDPYGVSEKMPAIVPLSSTKQEDTEKAAPTSVASNMNNSKNNNSGSGGSVPEATPEHDSNDDAEDEYGYSDDGFEEAYDDDDFED